MSLAEASVETGIILGTERYAECLAFYRDALGLPVWFEKESLVCLRFGAGYLMVEHGGVASAVGKTADANPTVLRFNVMDVQAEAEALRAKGIDCEVRRFDWGTIARFHDPDGNPCELKDAGDPFFRGAA